MSRNNNKTKVWRSLIFNLLVLANSEAFANTFVPHRTRSSSATATARRVLSENVNGDVLRSNGHHQQQQPSPNSNGYHHHLQLPDETGLDERVDVAYVAETDLPTELGQFRLRAYREKGERTNPFSGNEPSLIYYKSNPPFGVNGDIKQGVPVRIHDQCVTSEVFGSQR